MELKILTREQLSKMTAPELITVAKEWDLKINDFESKDDFIKAVLESQNEVEENVVVWDTMWGQLNRDVNNTPSEPETLETGPVLEIVQDDLPEVSLSTSQALSLEMTTLIKNEVERVFVELWKMKTEEEVSEFIPPSEEEIHSDPLEVLKITKAEGSKVEGIIERFLRYMNETPGKRN